MRAIKLSLVLNHWQRGEGEVGSFAKCRFLYLIDYHHQSCFGSRLMADKKWTCKMTDRVTSTQGQGSSDNYLVNTIKITNTLLFGDNETRELNLFAVPEQTPFADKGNGFRDHLEELVRHNSNPISI